MGLFGKLKDILFEEEEEIEETIPPEIKRETIKVDEEKVEKEKKEEIREPKENKMGEVKKTVPEEKEEFLGERDFYRQEKSSPFLDFDEKEFSNYMVKSQPKTPNVIEYERKKKVEKRTDYGRYEKSEIRETIEKKKFKPSPIISPVYGILNEDYRIEDIKSKDSDNLDIDKVRKKAFEKKEVKNDPKVDYYEEETVTVKYKEEEDEKEKKDKTIEDLLEDTSDEIIKVDLDTNEDELEDKSRIKYEEIEEELDLDNEESSKQEDKIIENTEETPDKEEDDSTIESDLFDLIDSMYEEREDGE